MSWYSWYSYLFFVYLLLIYILSIRYYVITFLVYSLTHMGGLAFTYMVWAVLSISFLISCYCILFLCILILINWFFAYSHYFFILAVIQTMLRLLSVCSRLS